MTQFDAFEDIDDEVDRDMGWADGTRRPRRKGPRVNPFKPLLRAAKIFAPVARVASRMGRRVAKVALFPIVSPLRYAKHFDSAGDVVVMKRSLGWRIVDGVLTRLLLTPVIVVLFLFCIVYANTHPARLQASSTPESMGVYFKRVSLQTIDNQRLSAWYLPPLTTDEVAFDPDGALAEKWPGVVVCHGLGESQDQYLSLSRRLHDAGFAVLMLDLRGQGESETAAVTYGLRERVDVLAGVKYLRELESIDGTKVCVMGHDVGAMAALQAAALDSSIRAVVADGLWPKFDARARQIFARPFGESGGTGLSASWLAPLYSTAFEVMVRERLGQLDPVLVLKSIHTQPVLFVARIGEDYTPVQDVMTMAAGVKAPHDVLVADGGHTDPAIEKAVVSFLMKGAAWHGPNARGVSQIEKLMHSRVK